MTTSKKEEKKTERKKLSLSTMVLISLGLGLLTGITFGDECEILYPIGDGFIRLLQMAILPYILVSLVQGIGSLKASEARKLALRGGTMLGLSWVVAIIVVLALPLAFPTTESASFFSTAMVEKVKPVNFLDIYIPSNLFFSMTNNMIPAVVLFSVLLGVALIKNPKKKNLTDMLSVIADGLTGVTVMVVKLTPIGVFALVARAAGTLSIDELMKIQVYVVSFIAGILLITFVVLPLMVTALTPFKYKQILKLTHSALVTGFTTGSLFIILPSLIDGAKQLFRDIGDDSESTMTYVDILVPVGFNFPNVGKIILLLFVCFAAWFNGSNLSVADYPAFILSGILSFFGSVNVAIPFLLDSFNLPTDLFQLFVISAVITGYFATLLAAMSLFCVTVLGTAAMSGNLTFNVRKFVRWSTVSLTSLVVIIIGLSIYFTYSVDDSQERSKVLARMQRTIMPQGDVTVYAKVPELDTLDDRSINERMKDGKLRIGYLDKNLPYSFRNGEDKLVGYDIDMIADFGAQLECAIELIPVNAANVIELLNNGTVDALFTLAAISPGRERLVNFTEPIIEFNLGFMMIDKQKDKYITFDSIQESQPLKIASMSEDVFRVGFKNLLPESQLIDVASIEEFIESPEGTYDAFLGNAESCSAWTLVHPKYSVIVPGPQQVRYPAAYIVRQGEEEFLRIVNSWLSRVKSNGLSEKLYNYWILGSGAEKKEPRWCLMRNVFKLWE